MKNKDVAVTIIVLFIFGLYRSLVELEQFGRSQELRGVRHNRNVLSVQSSPHSQHGPISHENQLRKSKCTPGKGRPWPNTQPMSVLLLRGASFFNYHVAKSLLALGHNVSIMDIFESTSNEGRNHMRQLRIDELLKQGSERLEIIWKDPCDVESLEDEIFSFRFSHVIVDMSDLRRYSISGRSFVNASLMCLTNMLEVVKEHPYLHFTLISSQCSNTEQQDYVDDFKSSIPTVLSLFCVLPHVVDIYHSIYYLPVHTVTLPLLIGDYQDLSSPFVTLMEEILHSPRINASTDFYSYEFGFVEDSVKVVEKHLRTRYDCVVSKPAVNISYEKLKFGLLSVKKELHGPKHAKHTDATFRKYFHIYTGKSNSTLIKVKDSTKPQIHDEPIQMAITRTVDQYEVIRNLILPDGFHDYVFTSYFTSRSDPQRKKKVENNNFNYMKTWFLSLKSLGMKGVVFHDGLRVDFIQKMTSHYKDIQFVYVDIGTRSTNDARFYAYDNFLKNNPSMQRVLLTDISDVQFQKNPFELMTVLGDLLFIGKDLDRSMKWVKEKTLDCYSNDLMSKEKVSDLEKHPYVYNAGVIGGLRSTMLEFLKYVTYELDRAKPDVNCNMAVVNYVVKMYFSERSFTGFPLTSRFYSFQQNPKGVYVIHK